MKIRKKIYLIILSVLTTIISVFGLIACKEDTSIELVDFEDTTVIAALNQEFSLAPYVIVVDTDDNTYKALVEVTDYEGKTIATEFYRFEPTTLMPYTAKVYVDVGESEFRTRTVTIEVQDQSMPKLTYSQSLYTGTAGSKYKLPTVTAEKGTEEVITPTVKVFYAKSATERVEQTVENNAFTPVEGGTYILSVLTTDQYGITYTQDKEFIVRPQMSANALEDFDHKASFNNASGGVNFNTTSSGKWLESYTDSKNVTRTGVVQISMYYGNQAAVGRFNKTVEELTELMQTIDAITVKLMISRENVSTFDFRFFGITKTIPVGEWTAISVSTEELLKIMQGDTLAEKIEDFATAFSMTGSGVSKKGYRLFGASIAGSKKSLPIYLDEIVFAEIEFAEYTAPAVAGTTFELPSARMVSAKGTTVCDEYTVSATNGTATLAVTKAGTKQTIGTYTGTTTVVYSFEYEGVPYSAGFSYTITNRAPMAANVLEDFSDGKSHVNMSKDMYFHDEQGNEKNKNLGVWHETYADNKGNVEHGVVEVGIYHGNQAVTTRFNRTEAELLAMMQDVEYITARVMLKRTDVTTHSVKMNGTSQGVAIGEWTTIVSTREALLSRCTGTTEEEKIAWFAKTYCAGGNGGTSFFGAPNVPGSTETAKLYVAEIYLGLPPLADDVLEDFTYGSSRENFTGDTWFPGNSNSLSNHLAEYTDGAGVTAYGVAWRNMYYGNSSMAARFNRTESELTEIMQTLDTLTVRLLIKRDGVTEYAFKVFGVSKTIPVNTWYEFTVTREEILTHMQKADTSKTETEDELIAMFAKNFCKTGSANTPRMFSATCNGVSIPVYLDSITFTNNN